MKNNYMKKVVTIGTVAVSMMAAPCMVSAGEAAPESIQFTEAAHILPEVGAEFDIASMIEITGADASEEIVYSTYDDTVAEVTEEGLLVANGYGITTIIASSAADETVCASMDVAVCDLYGTYSGAKTIEAMGCDIAVDITLKEDGTYAFYRAPMDIQMEGGGQMPELEDEGTYEVNGVEVTFTSEALGEFTVTFQMNEDSVSLAGKIPTGGPSTEMELEKAVTEESLGEAEGAEEAAEDEKEAAKDVEEADTAGDTETAETPVETEEQAPEE